MGSGADGAWHKTFEGNQQVCNVWWNGAKRKANLNWTDNVGNPSDWFAFVRYFLRSPAIFWREFLFLLLNELYFYYHRQNHPDKSPLATIRGK